MEARYFILQEYRRGCFGLPGTYGGQAPGRSWHTQRCLARHQWHHMVNQFVRLCGRPQGGGGRRARRDSYYHLQRTPPTCSLHCSRRRHTGLIVMHQGSYVRPPIHRQPNKACHHAVVHTISTSCHSWSPAAPPIPRGSPSPPAGGVKNATIATCEASCSAQTPHPHPHGAAQTGASQEAKAHVW